MWYICTQTPIIIGTIINGVLSFISRASWNIYHLYENLDAEKVRSTTLSVCIVNKNSFIGSMWLFGSTISYIFSWLPWFVSLMDRDAFRKLVTIPTHFFITTLLCLILLLPLLYWLIITSNHMIYCVSIYSHQFFKLRILYTTKTCVSEHFFGLKYGTLIHFILPGHYELHNVFYIIHTMLLTKK